MIQNAIKMTGAGVGSVNVAGKEAVCGGGGRRVRAILLLMFIFFSLFLHCTHTYMTMDFKETSAERTRWRYFILEIG